MSEASNIWSFDPEAGLAAGFLRPPRLQPLAPRDPRRIGRYAVEGRLGSGGMGTVYLARGADGHAVALKVVHPHLAEDSRFRARFVREVAAARRIGSRYTARVLDANASAEQPWVAAEYFQCWTLAEQVVRFGPLTERNVETLLPRLAEALAALHAEGVVHRDLKPSNILLAPDGPRVIDFGIARAADLPALTSTDASLGTPGYMSPEQIEAGEVGPATDIFALGGTVVFAVTGHGPFGVAPAATLMYRTVYGAPEIDDVPRGLRKVLLRCLEKTPEDRPTATELMGVPAVAMMDTADRSSAEVAPTEAGVPNPVPPPAPSVPTATPLGDASTFTALPKAEEPAEPEAPTEPPIPSPPAKPVEKPSPKTGDLARRRLLIGGSGAAVAIAVTATWLGDGPDSGHSNLSPGAAHPSASASSNPVLSAVPSVGSQGWILATEEDARQVVAVDIATQKEVWRSQVTLGDGRYLTVSAGLVFASGKGQVEVFDLYTGTYHGPIGAPHITGVTGGIITAGDDYVYVSCNTANQLMGFSGLEPKAPGPDGWTGQVRLLGTGSPNYDYGRDCLTVTQPAPNVVTAVSKTRNVIIYTSGHPAERYPAISGLFPEPPTSIAYSTNGPGFLLASVRDTVLATRWDTTQQVRTISCGSTVLGIAANGSDAVYTTEQNGFCAYRVDTGERLWLVPPGYGGPGRAVPYDDVVADRVFFSSADEVFAVDRRNGAILWVSKYSSTPRQPNSSPVLFSNIVYIAGAHGIRGFDAGTGKEVFAAATTTTFNMRPVICGSDGLLAEMTTQG